MAACVSFSWYRIFLVFSHIFLVQWKISDKSYLSAGTLSKALLECKKMLGATANTRQKFKTGN